MTKAFDSNTTVTVEIGFSSNPTTAVGSTTWTDVTADVRSWEKRGGRTFLADRFEAATATVVLNNRNRDYDPANTSSPYSPNVLPMRRIRVRATNQSTTYDLFSGFIDSWTQVYPAIGPTSSTGDAITIVEATDGFKVLALSNIVSQLYKAAILADSPTAYWRLGDSPRSLTAADSSGNGRTATVNPQGTVTFGVAGALLADADNAATFAGYTAPTGMLSVPTAAQPATGTGAYSVEAWFKTTVNDANLRTMVNQFRNDSSQSNDLVLGMINGTVYFTAPASGTGNVSMQSPSTYVDDVWHHVVCTRASNGTSHTMYVDGAQVQTGTASSAVNFPAGDVVWIGGADWASPVTGGGGPSFSGSLDEVAFYSSALSAATVLAHYNAGVGGFGSQLSSARVTAVLDTISWPSADRNIDTGQSTIVAVTESLVDTEALTFLQQIELSENGALFVQPDGKIRFRARHTILTSSASTVSQATFGDGAGEVPYSDIELADHDEFIRNQVLVTPSGGAPQLAEDSTSQSTYLKRSYSRTIQVSAATEAADAANWILTHYKDAFERVVSVTFKANRSNVTWVQALSRVVGDRVTVKRRPPGGGTKSADFLIEGVSHQVNYSRKEWVTTFHLSPAETQTYWVLGTSALGTDTRLAY